MENTVLASGWQSKEQATAILGIYSEDPKVRWLGISPLFRFEPGKPLRLDALVLPAIGDRRSELFGSNPRVTIAIDAPLGFPIEYVQLVSGQSALMSPKESEMANPLAFRDCERWVYKHHKKKPLSSPFDKLGSNATLAISLCQRLQEEGYSLIPQDRDEAHRSVIEVYPGIVKEGKNKGDHAIEPIHRHLPEYLEPGTDQYDAAICAVLGAVHAGAGVYLGLPGLVYPAENMSKSEGWIFGLSAAFVEQYMI